MAVLKRAKSVIVGLNTDLTNLQNADTALSQAIATETARAQTAESTLQANINIEKGRIDDILLGSSVNLNTFAEVVTLVNSIDTTNDSTFAGYVLANDAAVDVIRQDLVAEEAARIAADLALDTSLKAYTDAAVLGTRVMNFSEALTVSGDNITLTHSAIGNVIFNFSTVRHTDSITGASFDIPVTGTGVNYTLSADLIGEFNGKTVQVQYSYNY